MAQIAATTGWTWTQVLDEMTTPRYLAMKNEWRRSPPAHWLLAALLKYRSPDQEASAAAAPTVEALKTAFGQSMAAPSRQ